MHQADSDLELGRPERTPIVCLTESDISTAMQSCMDAGMDDCLSKFCSLDELDLMVSKWKPEQL